jgi:hypothetical protein
VYSLPNVSGREVLGKEFLGNEWHRIYKRAIALFGKTRRDKEIRS